MNSKGFFRNLVEEANIAVSVDDREGRTRYFNNKYANTFGYSRSEMEKQSLRTLVHPDDAETVLTYHRERISGNDAPVRYEVRGIKKDGTVIYLEVAAGPFRDKNGVAGTRAYLWDISEHKQLENKLNSTLKALRSTTGAMVQVIERMLEIRDPYTVNHQQRVADVIEAMSSHRPYRPALGIPRALEEISQKTGVLYDQEVVEACLRVLQQNGFGFRYEGTPAPKPEAVQEVK